MAAILQLRRGYNNETGSIVFSESELYYNKSKQTLQISNNSGSLITLSRLDAINTGSLHLSGDITASNLYLTGSARIDGNITLGGTIILGVTGDGNDPDTIIINSTLTGSLIPNTDNRDDLGSFTERFRQLHVATASIDILNGYGVTSFIESTNIFTASEESKNITLAIWTGSIDEKFDTLASVTGSITASLTELFSTSSNHADKFITLASYTGSIDDKFVTLGIYTGSNDLNITELFSTASNHEDRIVYLSGSFSQSVDDRLDQLETNSGSVNNSIELLNIFSSSQESKDSTLATYTGSIDNKFTTLGTYTASVDLDLASIHIFTSSEETKNSTLATYTGSVNNQLTELYATASDQEIRIDGIQDYTSSLKTAIDVNGLDVTVKGSLTVLGTATEIQTSDLYISDKVITIASGSINGAQADGSGIEIDGVNASMLWEDLTDSFVFNQKVSSSVGFKGDGSELTNIQHTNVVFGGSLIVSGASQVTESLDFRYLEIGGDNVVSGSSQINLTNTTNYISGIKDRLNAETVISGSKQITDASGLLSSSVDTYIGFSSSMDSRVRSLNLFTSSEETKNSTLASYTGSNDLNITKLFATASQYQSFSSSIDTTIKTKLNVEGVVSSSSDTTTIDFNITNGIISANAIGGIVSGSSQVTQSLDTRYEVSGSVSNLIGIRTTSGSLGSAAWYNVSSSINDGNPSVLAHAGAIKTYIDEQLIVIGAGDITSVNPSATYTADYLGLEHTGDGSNNVGFGNSGDVVIGLATGSLKFTQGVVRALPAGIISGSTFTNFSSSIDGRVDNLELFSSSLDATFLTEAEFLLEKTALINSISTKLNTSSFETYTGSNNTKWDTIGSQSGSWITESETGSFARTNVSNTFTATQTISGSLYITQDLIVQGSSSIQNISSSVLNIGAGIVQLSTALPSVRYAGWSVVDSGSSGVSASMLWDSQRDEFIFTHQSAGSGILDSSMFIYGPLNTGSLDNIGGILPNRLTKGESTNDHEHHITSSQISDDGITVSIPNNLQVTGSILGVGQVTIANSTSSTTKTTGALVVTGGVGIGGDINAGGDIIAFASSDRRLKDNIQPIENSLEMINKIGGYSFEWNVEKQNIYTGKDYGVIAQEIEEILPELVQTRENGYKAVKYDKLVSLLIEGIKDLSKEVEELKKQVNKG